MRTLFSTTDCYMGYNIEEECFESRNIDDLYDSKNIENESITFDDDEFNNGIGDFKKYLKLYSEKYEHEKGEDVIELLMFGNAGVWQGRFTGGRFLNMELDNPIHMEVDELNIEVDDRDNSLTIRGIHHDGTHYFGIYLITEEMLRKIHLFDKYEVYGINDFSAKDLEMVASMGKLILLDTEIGIY